jgi:predicted 2-oxoglutarate/Fe(II)-dependent dioxygenase YbiX
VAPLGVFVRERFLDGPTLARVRQAMSAAAGEPAEVRRRDDGAASVDSEVRVAWEVPLPDDLHDAIVERINAVRAALEAASGVDLEPCEALAALRYPAGAFYGPHRDVSDTPDDDGLHRRAVSIVVFANDGTGTAAEFGGGRLRLYGLAGDEDHGLDVASEAGTLMAFPSRLRHEVTSVSWGERRALVTWLLAVDSSPA